MKTTGKRRAASKRLQAVQTSRHFRVTHHRHTGKVTPHRTTSYPVLAMILLIVGVFLMSWTQRVTADSYVYPSPGSGSYQVHLRVPGPPPTQIPTIVSPVAHTHFDSGLITVKGTCEVNTYLSLYRNGLFAGVALCTAGGTYQMQTVLFLGSNMLQVKSFSLTDVAGPSSAMVDVRYMPTGGPDSNKGEGEGVVPQPAGMTDERTGGGSSTSGSGTAAGNTLKEPLIFKTNFVYEGHYVGEKSTWQIHIEGGEPPYAISVDWGDGNTQLISRKEAGTFKLEHTYKKPGAYKGHYVVKLSAIDSAGETTFMQLLAIVNNPEGLGGTVKDKAQGLMAVPGYFDGLMKYIWPGYGVVVLMLISFWLGERREFQHLKPYLRKRKHA